MSELQNTHPDGERAFLEAYDAGEYERPSVTVDVVLLTAAAGALHALVAPRTEHPARGRYALPGGFVRSDESLEQAAFRVLDVKAGLRRVYLEQLYTFGAPDRDPRTRVISVAYFALVSPERLRRAMGDGRLARLEVPWEGERGGPVHATDPDGARLPLAFDHAEVLGMAVKRLRGKLDYAPIGFQLLPRSFTLRQLQDVHEAILSRPLNKDSFRRRMLASEQLVPTGEVEQDVGHRPAELYRFQKTSAI